MGLAKWLVNGLFHWDIGGKESPVTNHLANPMAHLSIVS